MNAFRYFIKRLCRNDKGSVALIVALSMTALLGFSALVIDLGAVYVEGSRLQNALDSAALAAVKELPTDDIYSEGWLTAINVARAYAEFNHFDIDASDIDPVYQGDIETNKIIGLKITKDVEVSYSFARVLGIFSGSVTRSSSAGLAPAGGVRGAVPLCITSSSLKAAIEVGVTSDLSIKCGSNADAMGIDLEEASGWFGALRYDGSGASNYSNLLACGYSGVINIGQVLNMESGNMSGPTLEGFTIRFNQCTDGCSPDSFVNDCPRLVYIPVVELISSSQVKVVAFAAVFLTGCGGNGKNSYITATYIEGIILPNAYSGGGAEDFGLYASRLID